MEIKKRKANISVLRFSMFDEISHISLTGWGEYWSILFYQNTCYIKNGLIKK